MSEIQGNVDDGFGPVADAFAASVGAGAEGAAICVHVDGRAVVDLWGGLANPATGRPYTSETLQMVLAATKGATALCASLLIDRCQLDIDAPVAEYWPEFASRGKQDIRVGWLLSHRAGLPALSRPITPADLMEIDATARRLALQRPLWTPGSAHGYHALTFGWLIGELVRRVSGRSLGTFFADEIARPAGLDFWMGLPGSVEWRVAPLLSCTPPRDADIRALYETVLGANEDLLNGRALHASEVPAINGITTARSLSRMYSVTVSEIDSLRLLKPATVAAARAPHAQGIDRVLGVPTRFGLGFMLDSSTCTLLSPNSFGHPGPGGSVGFADPEYGVGFGYLTNRTCPRATETVKLIGSLRQCLD